MLRPAYRVKPKSRSRVDSFEGLSEESDRGTEAESDEDYDSASDRRKAQRLPVPDTDKLLQHTPPNPRPSIEVDQLADSMSALKFVPASVRFGKGSRGGFAKR
jgi:hypothetical protein